MNPCRQFPGHFVGRIPSCSLSCFFVSRVLCLVIGGGGAGGEGTVTRSRLFDKGRGDTNFHTYLAFMATHPQVLCQILGELRAGHGPYIFCPCQHTPICCVADVFTDSWTVSCIIHEPFLSIAYAFMLNLGNIPHSFRTCFAWYYGFFLTALAGAVLLAFQYAGDEDIWKPSATDVNSAAVELLLTVNRTVEIQKVSSHCFECLPQRWAVLGPRTNRTNATVDSRFASTLHVLDSTSRSTLYSMEYHFANQARYRASLSDTAIRVEVVGTGRSTATPLWLALAAFLTVAFAHRATFWVSHVAASPYAHLLETVPLFPPSVSATVSQGQRRLKSLDTFRGLCLVVMIFVNYGGGGYWWLAHSTWNGLTVADLVFPWFIWIMGVSMVLSLEKAAQNGVPRAALFWKAVRRSVVLFGLGFFLNHAYVLAECRVMGVLQRFGLSYFVTTCVVLYAPKRAPPPAPPPATALDPLARAHGPRPARLSLSDEESEDGWPAEERPAGLAFAMRDVAPYVWEWLCVGALLGAWAAVMYLVRVPDVEGCPRGYAGPGGRSEGGRYRDCTGGMAAYVDRVLLGPQHMFRWPTCTEYYECRAFDPEGTLGVLTTVVLCYLGVQAGRIVATHTEHRARLVRFAAWGAALTAAGVALCGGSVHGGPVPMNKNLWSPSFVLVLGGAAFLLLAGVYGVVDVAQVWQGMPLRAVGMNSIAIYVGHETFAGYFPFGFSTPSNHAALLSSHLIGVVCWCCVAHHMYKNKCFLAI